MSKLDAEGSSPALITDHPYVPPGDPNRHLCAAERETVFGEMAAGATVTCRMGEAAHAGTTRPYMPRAAIRMAGSRLEANDSNGGQGVREVTRAGVGADVPDGSRDAGEGPRWPSVTSPFGETEGTGDDRGQ